VNLGQAQVAVAEFEIGVGRLRGGRRAGDERGQCLDGLRQCLGQLAGGEGVVGVGGGGAEVVV
jgi:hypothetical protein